MAEKTTKKRTTKLAKAESPKMTKAKTKSTVKSAKTSRAVSTKTATKTTTSPAVASKSENVSTEQKGTALRIKKSYFITTLALLGLVALIVIIGRLAIAAKVNDEYISRISVIKELEKQGGKQALDSLITKSLILQEARKKNVEISQKDVDAELKKIDQNLALQGQKLDQVLKLQGMTKDQLVEQIRLQKMIEKMVGKVDVAPKEVDDYLTANAESLPQDMDEATLRKNVTEQLQQQKLNEKAQKLLEDMRKNAKINYFVNY